MTSEKHTNKNNNIHVPKTVRARGQKLYSNQNVYAFGGAKRDIITHIQGN
jgi:hypothetical protein